MPGQYKFTGNPRMAMYQPRGLEYFSYLPQLKAKVQGAAIAKAEELNFDFTGLAPQDLGPAQEMTDFVTQSKNKIVDNLISGESVTNATVEQLVKLARNKREKDQKLGVAMQNATLRQQFRQANQSMARQTNEYEYYNKVNQVADEQFGSTFLPDGSIKEFDPQIDTGFVDLRGSLEKRLATAMPELSTPEELSNFITDNIDIRTVENPSGQKFYKWVYKQPMDKYSNKEGLEKALKDFTDAMNDPTTEEGRFVNFMGSDSSYVKQFSKDYLEDVKDLYIRTNLTPSPYNMQNIGQTADPSKITPDTSLSNQYDTVLNIPKDTIIIDNDSDVTTSTDLEEYGVAPVVYTDKRDPENPVNYIPGVDEYYDKVAEETSFLFGEDPLTLNDLLEFSSSGEMAEDSRFRDNKFAKIYKQAINGQNNIIDTDAQLLQKKIEDYNTKLVEYSNEYQIDYSTDVPIDFAISPEYFQDAISGNYSTMTDNQRYYYSSALYDMSKKSTYEDKVAMAKARGFVWDGEFDKNGNPKLELIKGSRLDKESKTQEGDFTTTSYKLRFDELDKMKMDIFSQAGKVYNKLIADSKDNAYEFYENAIGTLAQVRKANGTTETVDLYNQDLKKQFEQSINEGAKGFVFQYNPKTSKLEYFSGTTGKDQGAAQYEIGRAINQVESEEGYEGEGTNFLHPTLLSTPISQLLPKDYFKEETPEKQEEMKQELDAEFQDAAIWKYQIGEGDNVVEHYAILQNKVAGFENHKMEVMGYVPQGDKFGMVSIPQQINNMRKAETKVVYLDPKNSDVGLHIFYGNGGGVTITKINGDKKSDDPEDVEVYLNKSEAAAKIRAFLKEVRTPETI